jgi:putative membrane protein
MLPGRPAILHHMKLIVRWLLLAAALLLVANLYSGVTVASFGAAMIAALVLGLLNTLLRPLLVLLTLPVTLLTLGLFLFVINALMFYFAASMLEGLHVNGFGAALIGSLIYSVCGVVIDAAIERLFGPG